MARPTVGLVDDLFKPHNSSTRAGVTVMKKNVFSLWIAAAFLFIAAVQIPAQKKPLGRTSDAEGGREAGIGEGARI